MNRYDDHSFVVCAYKESEFLEECIKSVLNQTVKSNVLLATSTPNDYIKNLCEKYSIEMFVNPVSGGGIGADWNFAVSCCKTNLVTVAHQDDIYLPGYLEGILKSYKPEERQILFATDYSQIIDGEVKENNRNMKVKRIISKQFNNRLLGDKKWFKHRCLSFGCPIGCPSVTLQTKYTTKTPYVTGLSMTLDWLTWLTLSDLEGRFVFVDEKLMLHRRHENSETANCVNNNIRPEEDLMMLQKFWIKPIALIIRKFFSKA